MAGAFHGVGEPDVRRSTSASAAPAWCERAVRRAAADADLDRRVAEAIKRTAFKITRIGRARRPRGRRGASASRFGIVDLSLAPTPAVGDSVARDPRGDGRRAHAARPARPRRSRCSTTPSRRAARWPPRASAASPARSSPSARTPGMIRGRRERRAVAREARGHDRASARSASTWSPCPATRRAETIAGDHRRRVAIGVINNKTTAVRIIPVPARTSASASSSAACSATPRSWPSTRAPAPSSCAAAAASRRRCSR